MYMPQPHQHEESLNFIWPQMMMLDSPLGGWKGTTLIWTVWFGFDPWHDNRLLDWCFASRVLLHKVPCSSDGHYAGCPVYQHWLVDVDDPTVPFVKNRWAIDQIPNYSTFQFQITTTWRKQSLVSHLLYSAQKILKTLNDPFHSTDWLILCCYICVCRMFEKYWVLYN